MLSIIFTLITLGFVISRGFTHNKTISLITKVLCVLTCLMYFIGIYISIGISIEGCVFCLLCWLFTSFLNIFMID